MADRVRRSRRSRCMGRCSISPRRVRRRGTERDSDIAARSTHEVLAPLGAGAGRASNATRWNSIATSSIGSIKKADSSRATWRTHTASTWSDRQAPGACSTSSTTDMRPDKGLFALAQRQGRVERTRRPTPRSIAAIQRAARRYPCLLPRAHCMRHVPLEQVVAANWDSLSSGIGDEPIKRVLMAELLPGCQASRRGARSPHRPRAAELGRQCSTRVAESAYERATTGSGGYGDLGPSDQGDVSGHNVSRSASQRAQRAR